MTLRHGFFVPQDALDAVGPCRGLDAETRLFVRLQNVYGVAHVELGPLIGLPDGVYRMYAITRHVWNDELAEETVKLFVQDAIVEFCRNMAKSV